MDRIDGTIQDRSRQKPLRTVPSTLAAGALRNKSRHAHDVQRLANTYNCPGKFHMFTITKPMKKAFRWGLVVLVFDYSDR